MDGLPSLLRSRRDALGLTREALRDALATRGAEVTTKAIEAWELGARRPTYAHLHALADVLSLTDEERLEAYRLAAEPPRPAGPSETPDPDAPASEPDDEEAA